MNDIGAFYIESVLFRFREAKRLGDGALAQLSADDMAWQPGPESNSIAVIIQHLHGNMLSRWTDFLTTDGEKPWRARDEEFVEPGAVDRAAILAKWREGWACLLNSVESLAPTDLLRDVLIRGQKLSALDAINRQLAHVSYHTGQMVYLARMRKGADWKTLSILRGESKSYMPSKRD